jgi:trehalose 6-phosphate synthase
LARIVIVSNRVSVPDSESGARAGGLEVALRATLKTHSCIWFGWSGRVKSAEKRETRTVRKGDISYIVTDLTREDYQEYYAGFANSVLWPVLHYRLNLVEFSKRDLSGYLRVNEYFADQLAKLLEPDDLVWVHDYHLIPLASALRRRGFANRIGFFLHIPLPSPDILTALPNHERLIPSLRDYDLVGFQTDNDAANFARYIASELGTSPHFPHLMDAGKRQMRVGVFPVGVEAQDFQNRGCRALKSSFVQGVIGSVPGVIAIGVDRLDYSKGLLHRLDGYERFLIANPDWRGRISLLQIAPKSRSEIQEYIDIGKKMDETVGRINATYGDVSWMPVRYVNKGYSRTALAGLYRSARVGLVTPLRDGMNLVAKEYVAAQDPEDPGVLVLSRFAGAAAELKAALLVNPYDAEAIGTAILRALDMPLVERKRRHEELFAKLLKNDISKWGDVFLSTLAQGDGKALHALQTHALHPRDSSHKAQKHRRMGLAR